jgi:hypothetical protein
MESLSLYRRVLGSRFEALPDVLRRFHDAPGGGRASGTFRVERTGGRAGSAVATLMGLPRAGLDVPVRLQVVATGEGERWLRQFAGRTLASRQWAKGNLLMERVGLVSFSSALVVDGSSVRYEFRRAWLAGIPLPHWLSPFVDGCVHAGDTGWRAVVHVFAPYLGEILRYEGWVEPE